MHGWLKARCSFKIRSCGTVLCPILVTVKKIKPASTDVLQLVASRQVSSELRVLEQIQKGVSFSGAVQPGLQCSGESCLKDKTVARGSILCRHRTAGLMVSVLLLGQLSELQHQLENRALHEMERQQGRHPQRGESQSCACLQLGPCWAQPVLTLLPAFGRGTW